MIEQIESRLIAAGMMPSTAAKLMKRSQTSALISRAVNLLHPDPRGELPVAEVLAEALLAGDEMLTDSQLRQRVMVERFSEPVPHR